MSFTIREKCIFCDSYLQNVFLKKDLNAYIGHYCIDTNFKRDIHKIPYNIFICNKCKTIQNKYLGNLNLVYLFGHNEGIGKLYDDMHKNFSNLILENEKINNIIEIGASVGTLSNLILKNNDSINYTIVEPNNEEQSSNRKKIIKLFVEDIDKNIISKNDTLVMSHILEHFYKPKDILDKLLFNTNIENFYLCWPDLDYYIKNNVLNVLTMEHTFYIDLNFLINFLKSRFNFTLSKKIKFKNHSIFLYFKRSNTNIININLINDNIPNKIENYFNKVSLTIKKINNILKTNNDNKIYLWPCSIHNLFLLKFNEFDINNIEAFLDNSKNKIDKRVYGINKKCLSFNNIINDNNLNKVIILNGGPFNYELEKICKDKNIKYYII